MPAPRKSKNASRRKTRRVKGEESLVDFARGAFEAAKARVGRQQNGQVQYQEAGEPEGLEGDLQNQLAAIDAALGNPTQRRGSAFHQLAVPPGQAVGRSLARPGAAGEYVRTDTPARPARYLAPPTASDDQDWWIPSAFLRRADRPFDPDAAWPDQEEPRSYRPAAQPEYEAKEPDEFDDLAMALEEDYAPPRYADRDRYWDEPTEVAEAEMPRQRRLSAYLSPSRLAFAGVAVLLGAGGALFAVQASGWINPAAAVPEAKASVIATEPPPPKPRVVASNVTGSTVASSNVVGPPAAPTKLSYDRVEESPEPLGATSVRVDPGAGAPAADATRVPVAPPPPPAAAAATGGTQVAAISQESLAPPAAPKRLAAPPAAKVNTADVEDVSSKVALPPSGGRPGKITSAVNMHSKGVSGSPTIAVIPEGTTVQLVGACATWCQVSYSGKRGFIWRDFVSDGSAPAAKKPAASVTAANTAVAAAAAPDPQGNGQRSVAEVPASKPFLLDKFFKPQQTPQQTPQQAFQPQQ